MVPDKKRCKRLGCVQPRLSSVWHTGLSGGAPDSVQCARLNSGEQAALGRSRWRTTINHQTIRWCTGQCPVSQRSAAQSARDAWPSQRSDGGTGQCPVCQRLQDCNGRLRQLWKEIGHRTVSGGAPDCPVRHPTEGKICLPRLLPTAPRPLVPIKGTPRRLKHLYKSSQQV
jgi:hypothetical protein